MHLTTSEMSTFVYHQFLTHKLHLASTPVVLKVVPNNPKEKWGTGKSHGITTEYKHEKGEGALSLIMRSPR